jgi:hypothetical protein
VDDDFASLGDAVPADLGDREQGPPAGERVSRPGFFLRIEVPEADLYVRGALTAKRELHQRELRSHPKAEYMVVGDGHQDSLEEARMK